MLVVSAASARRQALRIVRCARTVEWSSAQSLPAAGGRLVRRLRLIAVAASKSWVCSFAVPRHLARPAPWRLSSAIAPSPWVIRSTAAPTPRGVLQRARAACPPRAFEHVRLRRDECLDPPRGEVAVDGVGGVAGVGDDLGHLVAQPLGAVDDHGQAVGLMPRRRLGVDRDDHPRLGVGGDLRSVDEVWPVAGLVAQLGVRIGPRDRGRIRRLALRGRPRPRRSKRQRGPLARLVTTTTTVAVAVDDLKLGAARSSAPLGLDVVVKINSIRPAGRRRGNSRGPG